MEEKSVPAGATVVDPADPGHDVEVLREHVRHLERRIRELHRARDIPAALSWADMPKPLQDALLAYHARPCDEEAAAIVRAVLSAYGVEGRRTQQVKEEN